MKKIMIFFAAMIVISMQDPVLAQKGFVKGAKIIPKATRGVKTRQVTEFKVHIVEFRPIVPTFQQNRWATPVVPLVDSSAYRHSYLSNPALKDLRALQTPKLEPHVFVPSRTYSSACEIPKTLRPALVEITNQTNACIFPQNDNKRARLDSLVYGHRKISDDPNSKMLMDNGSFLVKLLDDSASCSPNPAN